jgi:hypothetical protein
MEQFFKEEIFWHVTQSQMIERTCLFCQGKGYVAPAFDRADDEGFKELHKNCKPRKQRKKSPVNDNKPPTSTKVPEGG